MRLIELILRTPWQAIQPCLQSQYPNSDSHNFEQHYSNLPNLEPQATKTRLVLEKVIEDGETFVDVSGKDGTRHSDSEEYQMYSESEKNSLGNQEIRFGLSFTAWEEWIAMDIDPSSYSSLSEAEIITHCLWEMTYHGFNQSDIQANLEDMKRQSQNIQNMSPEERAASVLTLEQLLEHLKSEVEEPREVN
jgi:hypothetical protein